jgi:hypothetical protein
LKERCGEVWVQRIRCPELGIDEAVETAVPRLLDEEVIEAVRARSESNRCTTHRHIKHRYLLARVLFCEACGHAMYGQAKKDGTLYYRHVQARRVKNPKGCKVSYVRAVDVEGTVMRHLFEVFGNPLAMVKAVEDATPDAGKRDEAQERAAQVARELEKVAESRGRLVKMVAKGTFKEEEVEEQMTRLREREAKLQAESAQVLAVLQDLPDPEAVKARSEKLADFGLRMAQSYDCMTWEEKRALALLVFGGKLPDGKRMGVYLTQIATGTKGHPGRWDYVIRGHLIDVDGRVPVPAVDGWPFLVPPGNGAREELQRRVTTSAGSSPLTATWT